MKCEACQHHLDAYLDYSQVHSLEASTRDAVQLHLHDCASCRNQLAELQLLQQLAALPAPHLSSIFTRNAFDKAAAMQRRKQQRTVFSFGGALAASLAVFMLIPMLTNTPLDHVAPAAALASANPATHHALPLNKLGNLQIAFNSSLTETVTITLTLPDHVTLKGYANQQQITWQTTVQQGQNQLTLPLLAQQIASGELTAEIHTASDVEQLKFILNTAADAHDAEHSNHRSDEHRLG